MPLFVLGIALLVGFFLLGKAFVNADPKSLAQGLKYSGVVIAVVVVVFLAVTGRLATAMAVGAFAFPLFLRWRSLLNRIKAAAGPSEGQSSTVETDHLRMRLDHDSGRMGGEVLRGPFRGRELDDLSLTELLALLEECQTSDSRSATILEAYLDRVRPENWRPAGGGPNGRTEEGEASRGGGGAMTRNEAYEVLGLEPGASAGEIKDAHRRLMLKMHPDQGGSTYLAAKINQAKDLLLRS
ncbi:molecular chaperone DnaJ [Skermanella stibiiresistens SB22]|uniref:Molecular chaperone DnaJ n=1 Tax=Skermanella stibiiresistens SB22 TaxID=1385369 RepID=W9H3L7_9PROT|nr:molecular chaperone DnaJ [Skermanella stibiiresistens SB22]